jgi:hypothetical protein
VKLNSRGLSNTSAIVTPFSSFEFLLVFFVLQVEIRLLGEINRIYDTVDNQMSRGAKVAEFDAPTKMRVITT